MACNGIIHFGWDGMGWFREVVPRRMMFVGDVYIVYGQKECWFDVSTINHT
jgi:hypothetical protein